MTTIHFKEYKKDGQLYLLVVDNDEDKAKSGASFLVRPSLIHPQVGIQPTIHPLDFLLEMSIVVDHGAQDGTTAFLLQSTLHDDTTLVTTFPLLGRKIISGLVRWGSHNLNIPGEFTYIQKYWEWTEDVLFRYGEILKKCSIYDAVYASLYSYDRDLNVIRAFYESWCPNTNTLHTMAGEVSISLWDLYRIGGLPISGVIYDETIPSCTTLQGKDKYGYRLVPRACEQLFVAYCRLEKKSQTGVSAEQWIDFWCKRNLVYHAPPQWDRYSDSFPRSTHNPNGKCVSQSRGWTIEELETFGELGINDERVRERTYLAAFLSCWLCVFVLPKTEGRLIRPSTFEIASQMVTQTKFSLAIPVLASIYRGLNGIVNSSKPAYSGYCFPAHYLYMWLAYYFGTHYETNPSPPGPPMVRYSGAKGAKTIEDDEARKLIHGGKSIKWGCMMKYTKNQHHSTLFDDGTLESPKLDYFIALRSAYLPLRRRESFHVEPYSPHRFSRQFGFCQGNPGKLLGVDHDAHIVTHNKALKYWKLLIYEGSQSKVFLPCHTSELSQFVTIQFRDWWKKVNVTDLRDNVIILMKSVESNPSKFRTNKKLKISNGLYVENMDLNNKTPTTYITTKQDSSMVPKVGMKNLDGGSTDPKAIHKNSTRKRSPTANMEDPKTTYGRNLFKDMCSSSNLPKDFALNKIFNDDQKMPYINELLPTNVNHGLKNFGLEAQKTKDYDVGISHVLQDNTKKTYMKIEEIGCSFPIHNQHYNEGLYLVKNAKMAIDASQKAINEKPSHVQNNFASNSTSIASFQPGPLSKNIFAEAIRDIGAKYLESLKDAPFSEVEKRYKEANIVYRGIEKLKGDPNPLKSKVDSYVDSIKSYIALESIAAKHKLPNKLENEILVHRKKVSQAESNLISVRANYNVIEDKCSEVELKIANLEMELRELKSDLEVKGTLVIQVETQVSKAKKALAKVESSQALTQEEVAKLERYKRSLLELQSSLKPLEWMDL